LASCDRKGAGEQHVGYRRVFQGDHAGDGSWVHRNRAVLSAPEHVHGGRIPRGAEAGDQHASFCEFLRPTAMLTVNMTGK